MDKFDSDLVNLHDDAGGPNGCNKCPPATHAGGHQDAETGGRGSDPRTVRPRSREQTDCSPVGGLPQLRPPLSRRSHGRLSRTSRGTSSRRRHAP